MQRKIIYDVKCVFLREILQIQYNERDFRDYKNQ